MIDFVSNALDLCCEGFVDFDNDNIQDLSLGYITSVKSIS